MIKLLSLNHTDDDGYTVTINDISIADGSVSEVVTNVVVTANNTELKANEHFVSIALNRVV